MSKKLIPRKETDEITFSVKGKELIRMEENGNIYIRGKLTTIDLEVVDAMREFLEKSGYLKS